MKDVYTFDSWSIKTSTFEQYPRNKAVVDVLWDKYILTLAVISVANLVIDMACRCIYTYDVGLCHCSFLGMRAVEGLDRRGRASTAARVFFLCLIECRIWGDKRQERFSCMELLKTFLFCPSRNHLVFTNGKLSGLTYVDVGLEISTFIDNNEDDRRLSMRVQDRLNVLFRSHIFTSKGHGEYLAIANIGILFEPLLKLDIEWILDKWSQSNTLFLDIGKSVIQNERFFLTQGCPEKYSISLKKIYHIVVPSQFNQANEI